MSDIESDRPMMFGSETEDRIDAMQDRIDELTRERDEARAEVERLQTASVASVDRWMEFVSHFQRLVKSNMGPEAGKIAIGYFKRAAEAGNLDEAGPPTITPLEAAAAERAAIVAWLSAREKNLLRLREGQALFGEDLTVVDGRIYELEAAIMLITRLDHHREPGKERGE